MSEAMRVTLVRADLAMMDAAMEGDDALAGALGCAVVPGWVLFTGALAATRDSLAADPAGAEWGARLFLAGEPPELVGWGGYKGPPRDGVVELGYEIATGRWGQGLATGAARAMLAEAFADRGVTAVIAHTLRERNASTRVLEKVGFRFDGESVENGQDVWRFRRDRVASHSPDLAP
jgi:ribosomal-protein-alanine N-acetyltransferase